MEKIRKAGAGRRARRVGTVYGATAGEGGDSGRIVARRRADSCANIRSMPTFEFTVYEHDSDAPWLVVSASREMGEFESEHALREWAAERWPAPRYAVGAWSIQRID